MKVKEILKELNLEPHKSKGQNFLLNHTTSKSIVNFSGLAEINKKEDVQVLEIGPGIGALTSEILSHTKKLALIELEKTFCDYLLKTYLDLDSKFVFNTGFQNIDLAKLSVELNTKKFFIISNVPYSVSSEFFLWLVKNREFVSNASLLFQREFSQRLASKPGSKEYGSLSILCKTFSESKLGNIISGKSFFPSAEVESRLIKLKFREKLDFEIYDFDLFEKIIRASFSHRRKTIYNSIKLSKSFSEELDIKKCLGLASFSASARAESFSAEDFSRLTGVMLRELKG